MEIKKSKIAALFFIIILFIAIFVAVLSYGTSGKRELPNASITEINTALKGRIISQDNFTIANSKKAYQASINTNYLDPNKKELFIKLYSIYSGANEDEIKQKLNSKKGHLVLSKDLDARAAAHLQSLSKKLNRNKFFISRKKSNGLDILQGLDITEEKQSREYPASSTLTPVVGYINSSEQKKGIENFYAKYLFASQDGIIKGKKDISKTIIRDKKNIDQEPQNGYDVVLNIPLKFQAMLEKIADEQKEELDAKEVIIGVMNSHTGQILGLATSARYDPNLIKSGDEWKLNPSFTERPYEPGSVMKPFVFAILLNDKALNPFEVINTHNGSFALGKRTITDTHKYAFLSAENVLVFSSNVGMIELSNKLNAVELYQGLRRFGFGEPSGVDLPLDKGGVLPGISMLNSQTYKATISYGYGLSVTFMQLLKAYNAFNNKGQILPPQIASGLIQNEVFHQLPKPSPKQVISQESAKQMKRILIKVVQKGTAKDAAIDGLEIGGKTGTAHIASSNSAGYANRYNGSFFGFANDNFSHSYTIGAVAIDPKKKGAYFGSQSALPAFKKSVELLIEQGYLKPSLK